MIEWENFYGGIIMSNNGRYKIVHNHNLWTLWHWVVLTSHCAYWERDATFDNIEGCRKLANAIEQNEWIE